MNFFFKFILSCQQFDNCSYCLPPVPFTPVANLPLVSFFATGVVDTGGEFAAGVIDTGGNFAAGVIDTSGNVSTGVIDTGGEPWLANISANFQKKNEMVLMEYPRAGGKLIHEKNQK